jgi:hypothetical protein
MDGLPDEQIITNIQQRIRSKSPGIQTDRVERRAKEIFDEYETLQSGGLNLKEGKMKITRSRIREMIREALQNVKASK